jgi:hypothetical protein
VLALEMAAFWLSGKWQSATVTVTPVVSGSGIMKPATPRYKSWLINCADSDTLIVFPHGFVIESDQVTPIMPDDVRAAAPLPSVANAALANWGITADLTNIYLAKQSAVGSGGTPALKVIGEHPHTFIR